ncbi:glycosyltransferase family 4 protein [Aerococcus urinae]|uniref:glycosyltransferase family 4 protein n=1 Tax=Aerococcus urinae TaxID=1376 RepID=UPI0018A78AD9|nr:glycosyltransferase family 4 protein [Aerococcus urinae]
MVKKILIISQYFYPEDFRINDIAVELANRGYDVKVLTGIPNYPEGKFYKGYNYRSNRREFYKGVEIIRIPLISRGKSSVRLALNYMSFVASGYHFARTTKLKPDVIFTYEVSPMTQALIGPWLAKRLNIKSYLYVLDLWPENLEVAAGIKNPPIIGAVKKMVTYIYKNTDIIMASSKSFVKSIQNDYPIDSNKVKYWPQYAEEIYYTLDKSEDKYEWVRNSDQLTIGFTGNIGDAQGLQILPKVASELRQEGEKVLFVIVGDGRAKEDLLNRITQLGVREYFQFIERQPSSKISGILAEVDIAFLSFDQHPIYSKTIPAKMQTYMACGKPLLVSASGEVEDIIHESQAGLTCKAGDYKQLTKLIKEFINMDKNKLKKMSINSRNYFEKYFSKELLMDQFEKLINER